MTNSFDPQLDAEYRSLIRSMHKDAVDTLVSVERWWEPDCFRITVLGGYAGDDDGPDGKETAQAIERDWRKTVHPQLLTLVYGHPDPEVRYAADILAKRLWSMVLILNRRRREEDSPRDDENLVATHLVHDGFARLRRAVYHAPFRVHRPSPEFDGVSVGNSEPLPGRMLQTIKELQEAGALPTDSPIPGGSISDAVRRLSDIFFMPAGERAALFADNDVLDPANESVTDPEAQNVQFGFSFPAR